MLFFKFFYIFGIPGISREIPKNFNPDPDPENLSGPGFRESIINSKHNIEICIFVSLFIPSENPHQPHAYANKSRNVQHQQQALFDISSLLLYLKTLTLAWRIFHS
ncbi:hypothetical protein ACKWTF_008438 [Chironomus riparius]